MLEADFEESLTTELNEWPKSKWFKFHSWAFKGLPDRIGCVNGRFVALEVKKSMKDANPKKGRARLQARILLYILRSGGFASFIYPENKDRVLDDAFRFCYGKKPGS